MIMNRTNCRVFSVFLIVIMIDKLNQCLKSEIQAKYLQDIKFYIGQIQASMRIIMNYELQTLIKVLMFKGWLKIRENPKNQARHFLWWSLIRYRQVSAIQIQHCKKYHNAMFMNCFWTFNRKFLNVFQVIPYNGCKVVYGWDIPHSKKWSINFLFH